METGPAPRTKGSIDDLIEQLRYSFVPLTEIGALASHFPPEDFAYISSRLGWDRLETEYPELEDTIAEAQAHWSQDAA